MLSKKMAYFLLCGWWCLSINTVSAQESNCGNAIVIEHPIIKVIDGTPRVDFVEILTLEKNIKKLQAEVRNQSLGNAVNNIVELAMNYLNKAGGSRGSFFALIKQWSEQRGRQGSPLCRQWCAQVDGDERAFFRSILTSFQDIEQFLADLGCFLKDLRNSCPRSTEKFKKMLAEIRAKKSRGEL